MSSPPPVPPHEMAVEAYEMGLGFWQLGKLDRAWRWLACAARHNVPGAADKLDQLKALMADLDIDETEVRLQMMIEEG